MGGHIEFSLGGHSGLWLTLWGAFHHCGVLKHWGGGVGGEGGGRLYHDKYDSEGGKATTPMNVAPNRNAPSHSLEQQ